MGRHSLQLQTSFHLWIGKVAAVLFLSVAGYRYVFNDIHRGGQCSGNYLMILQTIHQNLVL